MIFLNHFIVVAICMGLWLLQTLLALEIHDTVYTENGTETVHLPCGEIPQYAHGIQWKMNKSNAWKKILKFYPSIPDGLPKYFNYTKDKYAISDSINTSLVVKNIDISDSGLFKCNSIGEKVDYGYIILLQVVGKRLSVQLFRRT